MSGEQFWVLAHLTDSQLLEQLRIVLSRKRRTLAELVAHLAEVEERRLHLFAAHGSLFSYCVHGLGMSEDEACRRIELARLARKYPMLFSELASGRISLSVALLLKPVLSAENHRELLTAARGTSLRTARELLSARFPSPDVPDSVRKLPDRSLSAPSSAVRPSAASSGAPPSVVPPSAASTAVPPSAGASSAAPSSGAPASVLPASAASSAVPPTAPPSSAVPASKAPFDLTPPASQTNPRPCNSANSRTHQRIEPLSAARYRFQFTANADVKGKLELARDLMRHANPGGDFSLVISRALDLLLDQLLGRRFAVRRKTSPAKPPATSRAATPEQNQSTEQDQSTDEHRSSERQRTPPPSSTTPSPSAPSTLPPRPSASQHPSSSRVSNPARRAVVERDGLGCSWVGANGVRCGDTAWLEFDHLHPLGQGGSSSPDNLRLLCRAHNRHAAELSYGRDRIERSIMARREQRARDFTDSP